MRWLGIAAFVLTLIAATMNIIGFAILFERQGLSFGTFVSWTWPAALGAFGVLAGAVALGVVSVRLMLRADAEAERSASKKRRKADGDAAEGGPGVSDVSENGGPGAAAPARAGGLAGRAAADVPDNAADNALESSDTQESDGQR